MVKCFHHEQFPVNGIMGLIEQGAGHRHLRIGEHRIPACFLGLEPAPYPRAIRHSCALCHVVSKVAEPLAQCKHPPALPLTRSVQQRVELGA
jgi:hypothetical protein